MGRPKRSRRTCVAVALSLALAPAAQFGTTPAKATNPYEVCDGYEALARKLTGKPHYESQALVLQDEMPGQGHRLELFMNSGEGGRHSYTLLRIRREQTKVCIVTAGLVAGKSRDANGYDHLMLEDEMDPVVFDAVTCKGRYVITREPAEQDVCLLAITALADKHVVVSFGQILEDRRAEIPWPGN